MRRRDRRGRLRGLRGGSCAQCGIKIPRGPWEKHDRRYLTPTTCTLCREATVERRKRAEDDVAETLREWLGNAPPYDSAYLERDHQRHEDLRQRTDFTTAGDPLLHVLSFESALQALIRITAGINGANDDSWPAAFPHSKGSNPISIDGTWDGPKPYKYDATSFGRFTPPASHVDALRRDCYHLHVMHNSKHVQAGSVYALGGMIHVVWVDAAYWHLRPG
jgi:hypothetical protein